MEKIVLTNTSNTGKPLEATFVPSGGMNLISYKLGDTEVIDQNTLSLYEERKAGLGALIGPHFHHRHHIPQSNFDTSLFPHINLVRSKGIKEPFSHGIGRYVPWKYVNSSTQIKGKLHGSDLYHGIPLSTFEGQDFKMTYEARLLETGLFIEYKIESELPSVVGLHYYYSLKGKGVILGKVKSHYRDQQEWKPLPKKWVDNQPSHITFPLIQYADYGFIPIKKCPTDHDYHLIFEGEDYSLHFDFNTASDNETSVQIFHPNNSTYVCIEPLSATNPSKPTLKKSTLEVKIEIFPPLH